VLGLVVELVRVVVRCTGRQAAAGVRGELTPKRIRVE
jgi:hypothetical protein